MNHRPITVRVARWSATHPWSAVGLWVAFVGICISLSMFVGTKESTQGGAVAETARAQQMITDANFPDQPAVERVLISAPNGALDTAVATAAATNVTARLQALDGVAHVDKPIPAPDGSILMVPVTLKGDSDTASDRVTPLLDAVAAAQSDYPSLRIEETGYASISHAIDDTVMGDFRRAEILSVPITLLILLIAFGALIAAAVPVVLALSAVGGAIGLATVASHLVPAQSTTSSVILLIGMAIGVDYSLFYIKREREERARGAGHLDAVEIAAATSGRAVVVSGIAVMIAMCGMFLAADSIFMSFAIGSMLVVAVSVLGSLTVLPALLAKLGRWVDRPRVPVLWRLTSHRPGRKPRFWPAVLRPALRHPLITFIVSSGALVALAVPALGMHLKLPGIEEMVSDVPAISAYGRLTHAFPSTGEPFAVVVKAAPEQSAAVATALDHLVDMAAADPAFAIDQRPTPLVSPDRSVAVLELASPYSAGTEGGASSLHRLRNELLPQAMAGVPGVEYAVTGNIAGSADYSEHVKQRLPIVMGFVLLLTFVVMAWTFRSVVIAATTIFLNMLSVAAAYGLMVLVFQHDWAQGLLDFHSIHGIISWTPVFLFVVLFGLSMDYHVFVVSRIREGVRSGLSTREAIAQGITKSAGVVTSAAIVMVGVFSIFASLSEIEMKQMGVGLAAAIILDATIIRAVVLPSLMTLLGPANWWTPFRRRRVTRAVRTLAAAPAEEPAMLAGRQ